MKVFQSDVDEGRNNVISHVNTAIISTCKYSHIYKSEYNNC